MYMYALLVPVDDILSLAICGFDSFLFALPCLALCFVALSSSSRCPATASSDSNRASWTASHVPLCWGSNENGVECTMVKDVLRDERLMRIETMRERSNCKGLNGGCVLSRLGLWFECCTCLTK
ncbi:hypothetical protein BJ165DRAFT_995525 [Panaeolus papilionaceus]|nr:hypothetical protein BJ165DRAFT_995525 [Panaeolus papilionaceus]